MSDLLASKQSFAGPSRTNPSVRQDKFDLEGTGKFKLSSARGSSNKDKFNSMRERYDIVTAKREDFRKELDVANSKLKKLQAENDLLLDAMQVVAYAQPSLVPFLEPQPPPDPLREINGNGNGNGHAHPYAHPHHPHPDAKEFANGDREIRERHDSMTHAHMDTYQPPPAPIEQQQPQQQTNGRFP